MAACRLISRGIGHVCIVAVNKWNVVIICDWVNFCVLRVSALITLCCAVLTCFSWLNFLMTSE